MPAKLHVSLDVNNIDQSVKFYSTLFNAQPTKLKPGYAKFDLNEPAVVLTLNHSVQPVAQVTGLNHMGSRVGGIEQVLAARTRLENAGFTTADEMGTTCCYAVQDKIWATDPNGYRWEVYVFKGDAESFGAAPDMPHGNVRSASPCCGSGAESSVKPQSEEVCCSPAR